MPYSQIKYLSRYVSMWDLSRAFEKRRLTTVYDRVKDDILVEAMDDFPGVYMSWHLGGEDMSNMLDDVVLVFPRDLVSKQKTFHLNLCDKNGYFIEGGTFFHDDEPPDLAQSRADKLKLGGRGVTPVSAEMNEVVFHDAVSMHLCVKIYCRNVAEVRAAVPRWWKGKVARLPKHKMPKRAVNLPAQLSKHLNTASRPCRVFFTDIRYTGMDCPVMVDGKPRTKSSDVFVRKIAARTAYDDGGRFKKMTGSAIEAELAENGVYTQSFLASRTRTKGGRD